MHAFRDGLALETPQWDENLARSSQARAVELAQTGVLSHEDGQGRGPGLQLIGQGFSPGEYGEVLGAGADPVKVWQAWVASPSHKAILADPFWTAWGYGSAPMGNTFVYVIRFSGQ